MSAPSTWPDRATFESRRVVNPTLVDGTARLARPAAEAGVGAFMFPGPLETALVAG